MINGLQTRPPFTLPKDARRTSVFLVNVFSHQIWIFRLPFGNPIFGGKSAHCSDFAEDLLLEDADFHDHWKYPCLG